MAFRRPRGDLSRPDPIARALRIGLFVVTCHVLTPLALAAGVVDGVSCVTDPAETYAVYVPPGYTADRAWPVLFVLDARGRGKLGAELFEKGAEKWGWIVASSNDSASDGPGAPNERAIKAMMNDVERRYTVDPKRAYLAGFSGTARVVWLIGLAMPHNVAGVVVASGGFPADRPPDAGLPFAVYGTAGTLDFNYQEMRTVGERLDALGLPYRIEVYRGPHSWPPEPMATEAIAWLELQAMKKGLRPTDPATVKRLYAKWTADAAKHEADGDPVGAWHRYGEVARDFDGLHGVGEARAAEARLGASPAVRAYRTEQRKVAAWEAARRETVFELNAAMRQPKQAEALDVRARAETLIRQLQHVAGKGRSQPRSEAADRVLALFYAFCSFYLPRELLGNGDYKGALDPLQLAVEIRRDNPLVWYNLACAEARAGSHERALDALEQAVKAGFSDRAHLAADADLASLHDDPRYQAVLASLAPVAPP